MNKHRLIGLAALAWALAARTGTARADEPDVKEILKSADVATKAVKAVAYEAEYHGEEAAAARAPKVKGKLIARKGESLEESSIRAEGEYSQPGDEKAKAFRVATDSERVVSIDEEKKVYTRGSMPEDMSLMGPARVILMAEYVHPTPFSDEINGESTLEGTKTIGGVECHVVLVKYAQVQQQARWYFGVKDHLPRRVERMFERGGARNVQVLTLTDLDADPKIDKATFLPEAPEGYKKKSTETDEEEESTLLAVGSTAPDWELKGPDGKSVSLKSLRGRVVLIDFWATWCGPCKMAMPGVQKIHEKYADKPVSVYGVSTWERSGGDPAGYMKEKKYTFGLLLKGDEVADRYKVEGIPTTYVIGPEGKIVFAAVGAGRDEELTEAIEKSLPES